MQLDVLSLTGRVCALEKGEGSGAKGGEKAKGKGKTQETTAPGAIIDPWAAWDPWSCPRMGASAPADPTPTPAADPYTLDKRVGNRSTIIFGGFPRDTCRADMETALREIVTGAEGVSRVGSLGKYGNVGRVSFTNSTAMWAFINANKGGKKFDYDGAVDSIWFTIEKTEIERMKSKKVGYLCRALVAHMDGVYERGYVMYWCPHTPLRVPRQTW